MDERTNKAVDPDDILQGCPFKDCIPSIDNPEFWSASAAEDFLTDDDVVLGIIYKDEARAYPMRILDRHEIVNDTIQGDRVLISYCPLCYTGIAFDPTIEVDGQNVSVEFGVSGKLMNNNLIMYDRETDTLWQQINGQAIIGPLTGQQLTMLRLDTIEWKDWKKAHPQTLVLSSQGRSYDSYPYGDYKTSSRTLFPNTSEDDRLHPKTITYGVMVNDATRAYEDEKLIPGKSFTDTIDGVELTISRDVNGEVRIIRNDTDEEIVPVISFWFSWAAFYPDTSIYGEE